MNLLLIGFAGTITEKILSQLGPKLGDKLLLDSDADAIRELWPQLAPKHYSHILALGSYSGRDQSQLRIETVCTSKFRNSPAHPKHLPIPYFFRPSDEF